MAQQDQKQKKLLIEIMDADAKDGLYDEQPKLNQISITQTSFQELLNKLDACQVAKDWAGNKSWEEVYHSCHRGDWLLWLYKRVNPVDLRGLTLANGLCANMVRHLMTDERSIKAVDAAIAYGKGEIDRNELSAAHYAAYAAYADAAYADYAAAYAAYAAADAAHADYAAAYAAADAAYADYAAYTAAAYAAAATADYAARLKNQQETADIVRSVLPIEKWNIK